MFDILKLNPRLWFFIGFLGCVSLLCMGAYFQFVDGLEPCPLCISQRIAIFVTGLVFLAATVHNPNTFGIKIYAVMGAITALCGGAISIRHIWLQHLPKDQVPECGPGIEYMFANFPLSETIKLMLSGTGDCAEVNWTMLGMSMPTWTLFAFLMLFCLSGLQLWNTSKHSKTN